MARFVGNDFSVEINGSDYSSSIAAVTLEMSANAVETSSFGNEYVSRIGGLKDASITLDWHADFASGSIDSVIFPLLGANATVVVKPTSEAVSANNPSYTGVFLVEGYSVEGSVGELSTFSTTWSLAGTAGITRATA